MKIIKLLIVGILRLIYFLPVLALIILLVFVFGNKILGPTLPGSDNANFINLAQWLSNWFPRIPFWYPQQGAGVSFTISYPILNHLIVVIIQKITQQPIAVVFRVWSLVVVVLSSIGLFLLTFRLTKNQVVSSLAAIFYPLMPITWIFLIGWGFAAEQLSLMLVPPVLIFLSLFLEEFYGVGFTRKAKIYFLLYILLFALLPFAHPLLFIGVLVFAVTLLVVYPLFGFPSSRAKLSKIFIVTLLSTIIMMLSTFYWVLPYLRYQKAAASGAPVQKAVYDRRAFLQNVIYPLSVFSITDRGASYENIDSPHQNVSGGAWHNVSFPFAISLLALIGFVGSFFINRKVFVFGLANLLPLIIAIAPEWVYFFVNLPLGNFFFNWRATIITSRFIIPLLAGFGCYVLAYLFTFWLNYFSKKIKQSFLKHSVKFLFIVSSSVLTLIVAGVIIWTFRIFPNTYPDFLLSYGPEITIPSQRIDLRDIWRLYVNTCFNGGILSTVDEQPQCYNYPLQRNFWDYKINTACQSLGKNKIPLTEDIKSLCSFNPSAEAVSSILNDCDRGTLGLRYESICEARTENLLEQIKPEIIKKVIESKDIYGEGKELFYKEREILTSLPNDPNTRVDIGTSLGAFMMFEPFYSNMPELPAYYNQSTLMMTMWNYQIAVFNQKDTVWPEDSIMYELSKYFGLGYSVFSEDLILLDKFKATGWERVEKWKTGTFAGLALWKFNESAGLLNISTKPTILVIGQDKVDGYFRTFHLANLGTIPFDEAIIVKGGSYVDVYSQNDLSKFDAIILEGYAYKSSNHKKGWKILDNYVKNGGSLLINTGWQYSSADWKVDKTPDFFPLKTLDWISAGNGENYLKLDKEIVGNVDVSSFSPLIYSNKEWSVSSANKSALRDWAKIGISSNDMPLVAGGKYGSGKVVWMGFDLPGHIGAYKDNPEEVLLYRNLILYLLQGKEAKILKSEFKRDYPDKLEISINEDSEKKIVVYWSEAFYPDFKAKLIENGKTKGIASYKAGPGMTVFILPSVKAGSKIIYEYHEPIIVPIAKTISLFTILAIIVIIVKPKVAHRVAKIILDKFYGKKLKKRISFMNKDEDSDY
ncbi:MAG: hypothetical protein Q8P10_01545 [bacterium]|nr:hypothetical protein [bacterium]